MQSITVIAGNRVRETSFRNENAGSCIVAFLEEFHSHKEWETCIWSYSDLESDDMLYLTLACDWHSVNVQVAFTEEWKVFKKEFMRNMWK